MTREIDLSELNMKHFTIQDAEFYCQLSNIDPDNIKVLFLYNNNLTDISGVSIFKNLKALYLHNNIDIINLSGLSNLKKLEELNLSDNNITDLDYLKNLVNLQILSIRNLNQLRNKPLIIKNIFKNLPELIRIYCGNTFDVRNLKKELEHIYIAV